MPSHRPYAKDPGAPPSVTQIVGLMDKPGLSWGAARETALFAVHHMNRWMDLPSDDAVRTLYRHHRGVWDHRALVGSALHVINAEWCQGRSIKAIDVIQNLRDESRLWQARHPSEIYAELQPMIDGLADFWRESRPEPLSWEEIVRFRVSNPDLEYVGTLDWRASIDGKNYILDLKTTGAKPGKGKYWDVWRLQLAAYRYATEAVLYDEQDNEVDTMELPLVDAAGIVQVYADGTVVFEPIKAGPREHEVFLALRRAYGWRRSEGQWPGLEDQLPDLESVT
jgi:hypothetical protein